MKKKKAATISPQSILKLTGILWSEGQMNLEGATVKLQDSHKKALVPSKSSIKDKSLNPK